MLLLVGRTLSAIAAGRASYRGLAVSAAFVGGPPRRDAVDFGRTLSAIAAGSRLLQGDAVSAALVGGPTSARCF